MENNNLFKEITDSYTVCFAENCTKRECCMRYIAYRRLPDDTKRHSCVLPKVWDEPQCSEFVEFKIEHKAWGLKRMFDRVVQADAVRMKSQVMKYLGGHTAYYRYYRGEKLLSEEQQEWIANLFRQKGYSADNLFEHYVDRYNS